MIRVDVISSSTLYRGSCSLDGYQAVDAMWVPDVAGWWFSVTRNRTQSATQLREHVSGRVVHHVREQAKLAQARRGGSPREADRSPRRRLAECCDRDRSA